MVTEIASEALKVPLFGLSIETTPMSSGSSLAILKEAILDFLLPPLDTYSPVYQKVASSTGSIVM